MCAALLFAGATPVSNNAIVRAVGGSLRWEDDSLYSIAICDQA